MAHFKTELPTEAKAFIEALTGRRTFTSVALTPENNVLVLWEDDSLHTGLTVPVDFPLNMVKANKLPPKTYKASDRPKAPVPPKEKQIAPEAIQTPKQAAPVYLDEQGLKEAASKGTPIEYYGVMPRWIAFNPRVDKYIDGYFYRPKAKQLDAKLAVA